MKYEPVKDHAERKRISALIERCGKEQTMSKYIDVEWLKQNFNTVFWSQITKAIDSAPSIDIVRCGECKHFHEEGITDKSYYCKQFYDRNGYWREVNADDFCSYGERKEKTE